MISSSVSLRSVLRLCSFFFFLVKDSGTQCCGVEGSSAQVDISSEHGDEQDDGEPAEEPSILDEKEHHVCLHAPLLLLSDGIHLGELTEKVRQE